MKLVAPLFFLILFSCGTESENSNQDEIPEVSDCDKTHNPTVEKMLSGFSAANCTDSKGLMQGNWCIYGKDEPARGYPDQAKIEEGPYEGSKKVGNWIYYSPEGAIDSIISYDSETPEHTTSGLYQRDANGFKNGYWIIYGKDFPARGYAAEAKLEEGRFKDDIKDGRWIYFAKDGEVDSIVIYEEGVVSI